MFLCLALALAATDSDAQPITAQHDVWVDDASRFLDTGDPEAAVPLLTRYLTDVQQHPQTANLSLLGRAWLLLSTAHARRGKEDDARTALEELVRVRPDIALALQDYPPLFVRQHQKALQRARDKATAALRISGPDDASITVNGRASRLGLITHVPAGVHFVAWQLGAKQITRKVEVKVGGVNVTFGGVSGAQDGEPQSYFELNAPVAAPPAVIIERMPPPPVVTEKEAPAESRRPRVLAVARPPGDASVASPKVLIVSPAEVDRQAAVAKTIEPTPVFKQWWLWTIVGAVVAGATVATVLVLTAKVGDVAVTAEWK